MSTLGVWDLRAHYHCPLGAKYLHDYPPPRDENATRGAVWHRFATEMVNKAVKDGLIEHTQTDAAAVMAHLTSDPLYSLSVDDRDWLMGAAREWVTTRQFDPGCVMDVSKDVAMAIGETKLAGRLDLVEEPVGAEGGVLLRVTDFTTAHSPDTDATELTSRLNALLTFDCYDCESVEYRVDHPNSPEYVGHYTYERDDVPELREVVGNMVNAADRARRADYKQVGVRPGSWCHRCPGRHECVQGRRYVGAVRDEATAHAALRYVVQQEAVLSDVRDKLKAYCEAYDEIVTAGDQCYGPAPTKEAWSIKNQLDLWNVLEKHGEDPRLYMKRHRRASFTYRTRKVGR